MYNFQLKGNITVEEFTEVGSQDVTLANLLLAKIVDDEEEQENDESNTAH